MSENAVTPNKIKQIQDLIVGEYIDEWDNKLKVLYRGLKDLDTRSAEHFKKVDERLQSVKAELKAEIQKEKTERATSLQAFRAEITAKVESLLLKKVEKETIGKLLIQLGERVKNSQLK